MKNIFQPVYEVQNMFWMNKQTGSLVQWHVNSFDRWGFIWLGMLHTSFSVKTPTEVNGNFILVNGKGLVLKLVYV